MLKNLNFYTYKQRPRELQKAKGKAKGKYIWKTYLSQLFTPLGDFGYVAVNFVGVYLHISNADGETLLGMKLLLLPSMLFSLG